MVCEGANAGECGFWPEPQRYWKWDWIPRYYGHFTFEVRKMAVSKSRNGDVAQWRFSMLKMLG